MSDEKMKVVTSRTPMSGAMALPIDHPLAQMLMGMKEMSKPPVEERIEQLRKQLAVFLDPENAGKLGDIDEAEQETIGELNSLLFEQIVEAEGFDDTPCAFSYVDVPIDGKPHPIEMRAGSAILFYGESDQPGHARLHYRYTPAIEITQVMDIVAYRMGDTPRYGDIENGRHMSSRLIGGEVVHIFSGSLRHVWNEVPNA